MLLGSCFVPERYDAEIRLTKEGAYGLTYIGVLTYAPLFGQLARGAIEPEAAEKKFEFSANSKATWNKTPLQRGAKPRQRSVPSALRTRRSF
jgi:hypothetical protein